MATNEAGNTVQPKAKDAVFTKKDLISAAAVFGTTPALMTGALYGIDKEKLTKKEATSALAAFLKKPIVKGEK